MKEIFENNKIFITEEQCDMLQNYYELLVEWNQKMNLTAITEYEEVVYKHFLDSAWIITCEKFAQKKSARILDVGTGAGFPGIVLAVLCPEKQFVLLDSLKKRIDFLSVVVEKLHLENVSVFHGRAEDYGRKPEFRNQFDFVVSRAVAELSLLLEYCIPFVKKDSYFVSYKGKKVQSEIETAENAMKVLGCGIDKIEEFEMNYQNGTSRFLVFVKNYEVTDSKYPRRAGKPEKKPL